MITVLVVGAAAFGLVAFVRRDPRPTRPKLNRLALPRERVTTFR